MGTFFKVANFVWSNKEEIMRLYHHVVKHKVAIDEILDNDEKRRNGGLSDHETKSREKALKSYGAA